MSFLNKAVVFVTSPSHSRTVGIIIVLFTLAIVPLTVIISQQQQETRQHAETKTCDQIPECSTFGGTADSVCTTELQGKQCRIGTAIYECK